MIDESVSASYVTCGLRVQPMNTSVSSMHPIHIQVVHATSRNISDWSLFVLMSFLPCTCAVCTCFTLVRINVQEREMHAGKRVCSAARSPRR